MTAALETIFNQNAFDRIFIRQPDDVSCTAAALTTLARLYDLPDSYDLPFFRRALSTRFYGTYFKSIRGCILTHFPVKSSGAVYSNGIAYGSIRHKPDGDNHSVVFLAKSSQTLIYYDPYDHRIYRDQTKNMQRSTPFHPHARWVANMPTIEGADFDFWNNHAADNPYKLRDQVFWLKEHGHKNFPG